MNRDYVNLFTMYIVLSIVRSKREKKLVYKSNAILNIACRCGILRPIVMV